jgi:hypothetical protein
VGLGSLENAKHFADLFKARLARFYELQRGVTNTVPKNRAIGRLKPP